MIVAGIDIGGKNLHLVVKKDGQILRKAAGPAGIKKLRSARRPTIAAPPLADLAMVRNRHLAWESMNLRPSLILEDRTFTSVLDDLNQ